MDKYIDCRIRLDANKIVRLINEKFGGVTAYCKKFSANRFYFYDVLRKPHRNKHIRSITSIAERLGVEVDEIILEEK